MFILLNKKNFCEYTADIDMKTIIVLIIRFFIRQKIYGFVNN